MSRMAVSRLLVALLAASAFLAPADSHARKFILVQFDPNFQPPGGMFAGGRASCTRQIIDEVRSKFGWAGATIQVVTTVPALQSRDVVNTLRYVAANSTGFINARERARGGMWTTFTVTRKALGLSDVLAPRTTWVFMSEYNNNNATYNNSRKYVRGAGKTGAHEGGGHPLNASHTGWQSGIMASRSTATQDANTDSDFEPLNRSRMLSAARVGHAHPGPGGGHRIMGIFSQDPPSSSTGPERDAAWFGATVNSSNPNFTLGYINDLGLFAPIVRGGSLGHFHLAGGNTYQFAARYNPSGAVYLVDTYGTVSMGGPVIPASAALIPPRSQSYFGQVGLQFVTPNGSAIFSIVAGSTNNGFAEIVAEIPTLQDWGMAILLLVIVGFAVWRLRSARGRAAA